MFRKLFAATLWAFLISAQLQSATAQESQEEGSFIVEEDIEAEIQTKPREEMPEPRFITADVLTPKDMEAAVNFYIRSDISRKFSGLVTNLKLEKIYGILQEDKTASVYFDYSYTSVRNRDIVLYEKGKMTFLKFNSGRWFNAELSIFLLNAYPYTIDSEQKPKEE